MTKQKKFTEYCRSLRRGLDRKNIRANQPKQENHEKTAKFKIKHEGETYYFCMWNARRNSKGIEGNL